MRNMIAVVFIAILSFADVAMAQDEHVALFKNVSGNVKIMRGKSDIVPVAGTQLMRSDIIVSGPHSSGGVVFKDGTLLTVGPSTEIEISRYMFRPEEAKYDFSLYLRKGTAIYSSGKLGKLAPESVSLNTPRAAVGVRGTRFIVKAD
ncbi:MAG: FecR domain-containing protein [Thiobacillus sp.]|nr:FecR domain-containing protein [Thiobacillus sp.]